MGISFISGNSARSTSIALGAHQKNDLILFGASKYGTSPPPTVPSHFTTLHSGGSNFTGRSIAYMIAESDSEVSGTWSNAMSIFYAIYRTDGNWLAPKISSVSTGNTVTAINWPALTLNAAPQSLGIRIAGYLSDQNSGAYCNDDLPGYNRRVQIAAGNAYTQTGGVIFDSGSLLSGTITSATSTANDDAYPSAFTIQLRASLPVTAGFMSFF